MSFARITNDHFRFDLICNTQCREITITISVLCGFLLDQDVSPVFLMAIEDFQLMDVLRNHIQAFAGSLRLGGPRMTGECLDLCAHPSKRYCLYLRPRLASLFNSSPSDFIMTLSLLRTSSNAL